MRIWRASADEAPQVAALLAGFRDWYGRDWPPGESIRASVERLIGRDDAEYLLAARGPGEPEGVVHPRTASERGAHARVEAEGVVQVRYRWSVWWEAEDCWLEDLFVVDAARGAGLGRALTEAVLARAAARGCRRVELDVNSENPAALALYRSLGFETGKTGGQDLLMRRLL
jgi:ribosomal protein S18 acetylase RimI-like enzyme